MSKTDPMWVFENYVTAAELIDELENSLAQRNAEIEKFKYANRQLSERHVRDRDLIAALKSQQAASVGGEREAFEAWFVEEFNRMAPVAGVMLHAVREVYWHGWKARAALSPAGGGVIDLVFSGELPNAVFVEAEDGNGRSVNIGEWFKREDGYWVLRLNAKPQANSQEAE